MLGKIWKKLLLVVLIVACLFNIVNKLIQRNSLKKELESTLEYFSQKQNQLTESNTVYNNTNIQNQQVQQTEKNQNNQQEQIQSNQSQVQQNQPTQQVQMSLPQSTQTQQTTGVVIQDIN